MPEHGRVTVEIQLVSVKNFLTRSSGFLTTVSSHSLQPYRGCSFGNALCGVGCYVRHHQWVLQGRAWGSFLDVRTNAAESYLKNAHREAAWARRTLGRFSIFCSSATDPFVPQDRKYHVTHRLLQAMHEVPPDELILQTHSPLVLDELPQLQQLQAKCRVRVHVSIESDQDRLPGLPPPAASVQARLNACRELKRAGLEVVVTVAPLLPIHAPDAFFASLAEVADAVVIDHFIGGDGSTNGSRTLRTPLPAAIRAVEPRAASLEYRDEMVAIARRHFPTRTGVGIDGFAGRWLPESPDLLIER